MSIRLKLTLFYSITLAVIILMLGVFLLSFLTNRLQADLDKSLAEDAQELISALQHRGWGMGMGMASHMNPTVSGLYQLLDHESRVIAVSPLLAEEQPLPVRQSALDVAMDGQRVWVSQTFQGENFRVLYSKLGDSRYVLQLAAPLEQVEGALARLKRLLFSGGIVSLILAAIAGWLLAGSALSPIQRITATAASINNTRDLTRRVTYRGPNDEVGRLAATFNNMLEKLQDAYLRLEENNRSQVRFVSDASHELRTPLTVIRGNVELLEKMPGSDPSLYREALADISAEAKRMSRMVDDLLYLARSDQGKQRELKPVAVKPVIEQAARSAAIMAESKGVDFVFNADLALDQVKFLGDSDDFYRLLMILLDNAVKYTPVGGRVQLGTKTELEKIIVTVSDNGIGIDPEDLPHIFDRFFRADPSRTAGGTGLGLAIAKEIAGYHGIQLTAESKPGKGSKFTMFIARH